MTVIPSGRVTTSFAERRRRQPRGVVIGLRDARGDIQPRRRRRLVRRDFGRHRRVHHERPAAHERTERHARDLGVFAFGRVLPRGQFERRFGRPGFAGRRVREVRHFGRVRADTEPATTAGVRNNFPAQRVMARVGRHTPDRQRDVIDRDRAGRVVAERRLQAVGLPRLPRERFRFAGRPDRYVALIVKGEDLKAELADLPGFGREVVHRLQVQRLAAVPAVDRDRRDADLRRDRAFFEQERRGGTRRRIDEVAREPGRQIIGHILQVPRRSAERVFGVQRERRRQIGMRTRLHTGQGRARAARRDPKPHLRPRRRFIAEHARRGLHQHTRRATTRDTHDIRDTAQRRNGDFVARRRPRRHRKLSSVNRHRDPEAQRITRQHNTRIRTRHTTRTGRPAVAAEISTRDTVFHAQLVLRRRTRTRKKPFRELIGDRHRVDDGATRRTDFRANFRVHFGFMARQRATSDPIARIRDQHHI